MRAAAAVAAAGVAGKDAHDVRPRQFPQPVPPEVEEQPPVGWVVRAGEIPAGAEGVDGDDELHAQAGLVRQVGHPPHEAGEVDVNRGAFEGGPIHQRGRQPVFENVEAERPQHTEERAPVSLAPLVRRPRVVQVRIPRVLQMLREIHVARAVRENG